MKRLLYFILAIALIFSLAACGASKRVQEKAIENALGDGSKVNIDGDKYIVEDGDGNKMTVGGNQWPEGPAADLLPKLKKGTMAVGVVTEQICNISFAEIEKKDFEDYRQQVKDAGFTDMATDFSSEGSISYVGYLGEKQYIQLFYDENEKTLMVIAAING